LPREFERRLVGRMLELVREHPRYGYRRIWALLRWEGWRVNRKRIHRLWRREGLKVPQKRRKKRHLGQSANGCARRRAEHKDHVWAWDFIFDRTRDGRPLKWLTLVDEYTRENLALEVGRGMTAEEVIDVLADLFVVRGVPKHIRSDNGPEFIAAAMNSGPLSLRMCLGTPRTTNRSANTSITSSAVMPRPTSKARFSRVYSSTSVSHFSGRPSRVRSKMKSHAHTWSLCSARRRAQPLALWPKCRFFRRFCGTFSPSRRHSRWMRLRFTRQPSHRNKAQIRR